MPKSFKDFLNKNLKERTQRQRVLLERPYLETLEKYKGAQLVKDAHPGKHTDEEWEQFYAADFKKAVEEKRIPDVQIVYLSDIHKDCKSFSEKWMRTMDAVYGPEPPFIMDLSKKNVYQKDSYNKYLAKKNPGKFSEREFTIIAYMASLNPEIIEGFFDKDKAKDHTGYIHSRCGFWTSDLITDNLIPRENAVNHYGGFSIGTARDAAENLISEFEKGNITTLAETIANGIRVSETEALMYSEISRTNGNFLGVCEMMNETQKLLDANPELKEAVMAQLSEAEKHRMQTMIKMGAFLKQKELAEQKLIQEAKGEINLSAEEKLDLQMKIVAIDELGDTWYQKTSEIEKSDDYRKKSDEFSKRLMEEIAHGGNGAEANVFEHNFRSEASAVKADILEIVNDEKALNELVAGTAEKAKAFKVTWSEPNKPENIAAKGLKYEPDFRAKAEKERTEFEKKTQKEDVQFSKDIEKLAKKLEKLSHDSLEYKEAKEEFNRQIDGRIHELVDGYQKREVSDIYLQNRVEQLKDLKENPTMESWELPSFSDPEDKERSDNFLKGRFIVERNVGRPDHLKNIESFIDWRIRENAKIGEEISFDEFTQDDWELMYQNELSREAEKNPVPLPEGLELPKEPTAEEKAAKQNEIVDLEVTKALEPKPNEKDYRRNPIKNYKPDQERKGTIHRLEEMLPEHIKLLADMRNEPQSVDRDSMVEGSKRTLCNLIAKSIALGIIERHNGVVPGKMSAHAFETRMAAEPGFQAVVMPLIDEVVDQYVQMKETNPEISAQAIPKAQRLVEMIEDRSILSAFGMEKKISLNPAADKTAEHSSVKHAKAQLNVAPKPKVEEGPKMGGPAK